MKRIIFSLYTNYVYEHSSVPEYKRDQFEKYKDKLIDAQKTYAHNCGSDYELFKTDLSDYDAIQFRKLFRFEELSEKYDEVVYFDFDIVPQTDRNIFEAFDLNTICGYGIVKKPTSDQMYSRLKNDSWHKMDMYSKTCAKNAMLLLDDIIGNDEVLNTGVLCGNKKSIKELAFKDRFIECRDTFVKARKDNLYPEEINKSWIHNNEVYISYIIEKYNVPYTNIGIQWNFILDKSCPEPSAAAYILHHVNKNFGISFNA
jgi:hypothetical protein